MLPCSTNPLKYLSSWPGEKNPWRGNTHIFRNHPIYRKHVLGGSGRLPDNLLILHRTLSSLHPAPLENCSLLVFLVKLNTMAVANDANCNNTIKVFQL